MTPDAAKRWIERELARLGHDAGPSDRRFPSRTALADLAPESVLDARDFYRKACFDWGSAWIFRFDVEGESLFVVYAGTDGAPAGSSSSTAQARCSPSHCSMATASYGSRERSRDHACRAANCHNFPLAEYDICPIQVQQLEIEFSEHGGARENAGRPRGVRPKVRHRPRERHRRAHPVHVTMRAREGLPSLREPVLMREVMRRIRAANASPHLRDVFRVVHFSIQDDHVHLVVEAKNGALSRGVQGLAIRIAKHVNALLSIRGSFWGDRFHSRELANPRAVRNAIVYVLMNVKKHIRRWGDAADPCSSAPWFFALEGAEPPVRTSSTWLGTTGWLRHGRIGIEERPRAPS